MILPIGDAPNPQGFRAWVTWGLLLANVLVYLLVTLPLSLQAPDLVAPGLSEYLAWLQLQVPGATQEQLLAQISAYDLFVFAHGYQPGRPSWTDLFSGLFLHSGVAHLGGNLLFLWIYGDNVEHRLGRVPYLLAYLGAGVAATLAFSAFAGTSLTPLIGASGAISGVLGFYFVFFPRNHVRLLVLLPPFIFQRFLMSAQLVLGAYIVLDNLLPILFHRGGSVAYGAHLGGFVAGAAVALVISSLSSRLPQGSSASEAQGALQEAVRAQDSEAARVALHRAGRAEVAALTPAERLQLATWLAQDGALGAVVALARPLARSGGPLAAQASLLVGEAHLRAGQPAAAYAWLVQAAQQTGDPAVAARARNHVDRLVG